MQRQQHQKLPQIGPYQTTHFLGRGGMAVVYAAHQEDGTPIAIKWAHPVAEDDERGHQRLVREFTSLKRLQHPNIVKVFELGTWNDRPYYTMELVEGHSLAHFIDRVMGRPVGERYNALLPISTEAQAQLSERSHIDNVIHFLKQLSSAVSCIHEHNMIHRDIKPDNVFIRETDGHLTLMDFGIIKSTNQQLTQFTQVNNVIGTYKYFSPEQARSEPLTTASDLYNIGLILYELMTGRFPFHSDAGIGYLFHHARTAPKPATGWNSDIPADLNKLINTLLQKDSDDRPSSAAALLEHLNNLSETHQTTDVSSLFLEMTGERLQLRLRPRWINHSPALGELDAFFEESAQNKRAILRGQHGSGKGRIIREWRSRKYLGMPVISFDCRGSGTGPLHTLNGLLYHIFKQCPPAHLPELKNLRRWLAPTRQHMMRALLCMNALEDIRADLIHRVTHFLTELFETTQCPFIFEHIDDADPMTQQLFYHWIRQHKPTFSWVVTTKQQHLPETTATVIDVPAMDVDAIRHLIADMCRVELFHIERHTAEAALVASQGAPGFVSTCLYQANMSGFVMRHGPRLTFQPVDTLHAREPAWWHAMRAADAKQVESVTTSSKEILLTLALFDRSISQRMLLQVLEAVDEVTLEQRLQMLIEEGRVTEDTQTQTYRLSSRISSKDLIAISETTDVDRIRLQVERAIRADKYLSRTYPETLAQHKIALGHQLSSKEQLTLALRSARWGLLTDADKWIQEGLSAVAQSRGSGSSITNLGVRIKEHFQALHMLIQQLKNAQDFAPNQTSNTLDATAHTSFLQAARLKLANTEDLQHVLQASPRVKSLIGNKAWNYWCFDRAHRLKHTYILNQVTQKMSGQSQLQSSYHPDLVRLRGYRIGQGAPQIFPDFDLQAYVYIEDACHDLIHSINQNLLSNHIDAAQQQIRLAREVFAGVGVHRFKSQLTFVEYLTTLFQSVFEGRDRPAPPARHEVPTNQMGIYTALRGLHALLNEHHESAHDAFENAIDLFQQGEAQTALFATQALDALCIHRIPHTNAHADHFYLNAESLYQPAWTQDIYNSYLRLTHGAEAPNAAFFWPLFERLHDILSRQWRHQ